MVALSALFALVPVVVLYALRARLDRRLTVPPWLLDRKSVV